MSLPFRLLSIVALCCGVLLAGCQSPPKVGEITVTIVDATSPGQTLTQSRAILSLRFINENLVPVALEGSKHKLYLNGTYVGEAVNGSPIGLAPSSTRIQEVPIIFENTELVRRLAQSSNPVVSYRLVNVMEYRKSDETEYLKSETNATIDLSGLISR